MTIVIYCCQIYRYNVWGQWKKLWMHAYVLYTIWRWEIMFPHITEMHILPIRYPIMYKTCVMVYKILNGLAPSYMNDFVVLHFPSEFSLRSNNDNLIISQMSYRNTIQHAMIANWNCLPYHLRSLESLITFEKQLKTHYFTLAFP